MDYLSELGRFLQEIFTRWPELAIGGIVGFAWLIWEKCTEKPVPMKIFGTILVVTFFFAAFNAWREQYLKVKEGPKLRGFVTSSISGETGDDKKDTSVLMLLGIINAGPPTTVTGFTATVKWSSSELTLHPKHLPDNARFGFEEGQSVPFKTSEMIYNKVVTPIPQGGRVDGFIFYVVEGIRRDELWKQKPVFTISFADAAGNEYHVVVKEGETAASSPVYVPGVDNPFIPFMSKPKAKARPPSPSPDTGASPR